MEDYSKYLSFDNGKGLLLKKSDAYILDSYNINYHNVSNMSELIMLINHYIDNSEEYDNNELESVLSNLMESHYYNETNK